VVTEGRWIGADRKTVAFELQAVNKIHIWTRDVTPVLVVRCQAGRVDPFVFTQSAARMETQDEDHTVRIYSPFAGRVARILVQPGASVRKGQVLAVLGSPEFGQAQADARRAETDVRLSETNLQRLKELESHGVAPRKDLQTAEAEYARAKAELDRTRSLANAHLAAARLDRAVGR